MITPMKVINRRLQWLCIASSIWAISLTAVVSLYLPFVHTADFARQLLLLAIGLPVVTVGSGLAWTGFIYHLKRREKT